MKYVWLVVCLWRVLLYLWCFESSGNLKDNCLWLTRYFRHSDGVIIPMLICQTFQGNCENLKMGGKWGG
ncbi:hypothetical protein BVI434_960013 [Burkholderia vietnamiensis]|nr:hypothetical protein BVI434_960013 [Burkholderia vietnamiensis]